MSFFGIFRYVCGFCQMRPVYAPIFTEDADYIQDGEIEFDQSNEQPNHHFEDVSVHQISQAISPQRNIESFDLEIEEDEHIESDDDDRINDPAYQQSINQSVNQIQDQLDSALKDHSNHQVFNQSIAAHIPALPSNEQSINQSTEPNAQPSLVSPAGPVLSRRSSIDEAIDQAIVAALTPSSSLKSSRRTSINLITPPAEPETFPSINSTNADLLNVSTHQASNQSNDPQLSVTPDLSLDKLIEHVTPADQTIDEQPHQQSTVIEPEAVASPDDKSTDPSLNQPLDKSLTQTITALAPLDTSDEHEPAIAPRRKSSVKHPVDQSIDHSTVHPNKQSTTTTPKSQTPSKSPHRRRSSATSTSHTPKHKPAEPVEQKTALPAVQEPITLAVPSAATTPKQSIKSSVAPATAEAPIVVSVVSSQSSKSKKQVQPAEALVVVPHPKPVLPVAKPALQFVPGSNPLLSLGIPRGQLSVQQLQQLIDALSPNNQSINQAKLPLIDAIRENLTWMHVWQFLISTQRSINQATFRHFAQPILREQQSKKSSNQNLSLGLQWLKFFNAHLVSIECTANGVSLHLDQANRTLDCSLPDQWSIESKHPSDPFLVHPSNQAIKQTQDSRRVVFAQTVRCLIDSQRGLYGITPNDLNIKKIFNFSVNLSYAYSPNKLDRDSNGRIILDTDEQGKPIVQQGHYVAARYDDWLIGTVLGQTVELGLPSLKKK